uniref:Uncharacterized protein n=1 Tax=Electrophorus electricus TaxID=8005 RepID=A0A4W4H921_ELEEL
MGSALGLARRTLRSFPFHCMPCTRFKALSLSSYRSKPFHFDITHAHGHPPTLNMQYMRW